MHRSRSTPWAITLIAFLFLISPLLAKTELPAGGVALLPGNITVTGGFWPGENGGSPVASASVVSVDHPDFTQARRVTVSNPAGQFWNGALQFTVNQAVAEGDVMMVRLFFRSIESNDESGVGFATVFPQGPAPDFNKYLQREITATDQWTEYLLPFVMTESLPSGQLSLQIGAGAGSKTQIWEVAGIEFINYQQTLALDDLPITRPSYAGRELDASWRDAAAARIEQHRKGDFQLKVLDANGDPIPNADISIEFLRHSYHFGSVIVSSIIMGTGSDNDTYREKFLDLFNQSGPENDFKWGPWAGEWGSSYAASQTLAAMQWLRDRDIYTRGHVMVWPSKGNLPNLIQSYLPEGNPAAADPEAKQIVLDHIDDVASRSADYVDEWDVLNEPYDNYYLMDAFGDEVMVDWFEQARAHLERHALYINDYGILSAGGRDFAHQDHYEETIRYLLENDAPLNGIGMQGHFSSSPTGIERIYDIFERYHNAFPELDIRVTEFDISTEDEEMQADFTRDFLTIAFSHPATVGVQCWGFWENAHWRSDAAMYTSDWREKPNAVAWRTLTKETWWNDFQGATDASGLFSDRGFYGDYRATITIDGEAHVYDFSLAKGGATNVTLQIGSDPSNTPPPELSIGHGREFLELALSQHDGEPYVLQTSGDLENWKTILDLENLTPGLSYEHLFYPEATTFFRILEK
ncbi:endo-1,4-beta-xylanase [Pelagicoccus sp. SDUM812003]|nr:endo-1,4-beta-xylanase [Pelagicoccus sp. SDUM812003]